MCYGMTLAPLLWISTMLAKARRFKIYGCCCPATMKAGSARLARFWPSMACAAWPHKSERSVERASAVDSWVLVVCGGWWWVGCWRPFGPARMEEPTAVGAGKLVLSDGGKKGVFTGGVGDADRDRAEFAIVLLREAIGIGLSSLLLRRLMGYARAQGIRELFGEILRENKPMLELCRAMGFTIKPCPDDHEVMIATLRLS